MSMLSKAIYTQIRMLLENERQTYIMTALLTVVPFLSWIAVAIMAFITLRKGARPGFYTMLCGLAAFLFTTFLITSLKPAAIVTILLTFVPCYLAALVLRVTASWGWTVTSLLSFATITVLLLNISTPDFLVAQYHVLQGMLKELQHNDVQLTGFLGSPSQIMAYLLGIQSLVYLISILSTLILARALQSKLFYPEGFKQEILSFEAHPLMVFPLCLILFGAYQHTPVAISLLPSWVLYFVCAGLSLMIAQFKNKKPLLILVLLLIPMVLLPLVVLPTIAGIGIIDSFFHFRRRFANHL